MKRALLASAVLLVGLLPLLALHFAEAKISSQHIIAQAAAISVQKSKFARISAEHAINSVLTRTVAETSEERITLTAKHLAQWESIA